MNLFRYPLILLVLFALGCGSRAKIQETVQPAVQPAVQIDPLPAADALEVAKNGKLNCEFNNECDPSVALVSIATPENIQRCSGFLISKNEVLTNDHCVDSIPDRKTACHGRVFIHFNGNIHRGCKSIRARSYVKDSVSAMDYAVIELDHPVTDRVIRPLAKRGFNANEMASIFAVQMNTDKVARKYNGVQRKLTCPASYQTVLDINVKSPLDARMTFGDCAIQHGNSGSPVLNSNGEVGAIVQGYLTISSQFQSLFEPYLSDQGAGNVGLATQVACMAEVSPATAKFCTQPKPILTVDPKEYLARFGGFFKPPLSWTPFHKNTEIEKNFLTSSVCVSESNFADGQDQFTSTFLKSYRLGLNHYLQSEWLDVSEKRNYVFNFQRTLVSNQKLVTYSEENFGTISVPVCERR